MLRLHQDDRGLTLTELMVAAVIISILSVVVMTLMSSFLGHSQGQIALAETQDSARLVLRDLLIELRESRSPDLSHNPVTEVDWNLIAVHADTAPTDGVLDKIVYELRDCVDGLCDLYRTVTPPTDPTTNPVEYNAVNASPSVLVAKQVIASPAQPLFRAVDWDADTHTRTVVSTCDDTTSTPCRIGLIEIDIHMKPLTSRENPGILHIYEEVRLRNAK